MGSTPQLIANANARFNLRLGVVGHAPHWIGPDGRPWAYEPYVREMRIWADLFSEILICSPRGEGALNDHLAPYLRENIEWHPVPYTLSYGLAGMAKRLVQLGGVFVAARRAILASDFIQLRSPGHFGLVGAVWVRVLKRPSITKWAGENGAYAGERLPSRIERELQNIPSDLHTILVYGQPNGPNQVGFLPALMTAEELCDGYALSQEKLWDPPWRILSVGRLEEVKGFDLGLKGLRELKRNRPEICWTYTIIGDGPMRQQLEDLAEDCGIKQYVTFAGALPFKEVQKYYGASHVAIMPGIKEGWPKIIAEAWAHRAIPVAASAGLVPWILQDPDSGIIFEPHPHALGSVLSDLFDSKQRMQEMSDRLAGFAKELSLDHFKMRLERVLVDRCGLT